MTLYISLCPTTEKISLPVLSLVSQKVDLNNAASLPCPTLTGGFCSSRNLFISRVLATFDLPTLGAFDFGCEMAAVVSIIGHLGFNSIN